jgi:hypothetical protein
MALGSSCAGPSHRGSPGDRIWHRMTHGTLKKRAFVTPSSRRPRRTRRAARCGTTRWPWAASRSESASVAWMPRVGEEVTVTVSSGETCTNTSCSPPSSGPLPGLRWSWASLSGRQEGTAQPTPACVLPRARSGRQEGVSDDVRQTAAWDEEQARVLPPWSRLPASRSERPRTLWNTSRNAGSVIVLPGGTCWGHGGAVVAETLWAPNEVRIAHDA